MSRTLHNPAFPFARSGPDSDFIHRKVVEKIYDPSFHFRLPELSQLVWTTICNNNHERERLEFVGDALMSSAVAEELYRVYRDVSPGFYTKIRSILTANSTFAHLMHKVGFHKMTDPVKPAGDAFETIIAAYHQERGREALTEWVKQNFMPLIEVAGAAHQIYQIDTVHRRKQKRRQVPGHERQLLNKPRLLSIHKRTTHIPSLKGSPARPYRTSSLPSMVTPRPSQPRSSDAAQKTIIDLTDDSEWEDLDNDDGIQELSPNSFYGTRYTALAVKNSPAVKASTSKGSDLFGSSNDLAIKKRAPSTGSSKNLIEFAPSTPIPAMKGKGKSAVRECVDIDEELASRLQRTPVLGSDANPIIID